jgi:hypothetical protein
VHVFLELADGRIAVGRVAMLPASTWVLTLLKPSA